jgi:hypothetical protein
LKRHRDAVADAELLRRDLRIVDIPIIEDQRPAETLIVESLE